MSRRFGWIVVPLVPLILGCPPQPSTGPGGTGSVQLEGPGFSVVLPSGTKPLNVWVDMPGASYQALYEDELAHRYAFLVIGTNSIPSFSGDENNSSTRFDGTGLTSTGDFIIVATSKETYGDLASAYAELADGQLLVIGTEATNPVRNIVFASIDLFDTDGAGIEQGAEEGLPRLAAPTTGDVVLLDDGVAYKVLGSAERRRVSRWGIGNAIMTHEATGFVLATDPFFLTKIGEWQSVSANYLGVADRATITNIVDLASGTANVYLSNGSTWYVAVADEQEVRNWQVGDQVAVLKEVTTYYTSYSLFRVASGVVAAVQPG